MGKEINNTTKWKNYNMFEQLSKDNLNLVRISQNFFNLLMKTYIF